jgi:hypothetical protein
MSAARRVCGLINAGRFASAAASAERSRIISLMSLVTRARSGNAADLGRAGRAAFSGFLESASANSLTPTNKVTPPPPDSPNPPPSLTVLLSLLSSVSRVSLRLFRHDERGVARINARNDRLLGPACRGESRKSRVNQKSPAIEEAAREKSPLCQQRDGGGGLGEGVRGAALVARLH